MMEERKDGKEKTETKQDGRKENRCKDEITGSVRGSRDVMSSKRVVST